MARERDDETGLYEEVYPEEEILAYLAKTRLSTTEVADKLGCHRTTAHTKLRELESEDKVTATQVGNTLLWEVV